MLRVLSIITKYILPWIIVVYLVLLKCFPKMITPLDSQNYTIWIGVIGILINVGMFLVAYLTFVNNVKIGQEEKIKKYYYDYLNNINSSISGLTVKIPNTNIYPGNEQFKCFVGTAALEMDVNKDNIIYGGEILLHNVYCMINFLNQIEEIKSKNMFTEKFRNEFPIIIKNYVLTRKEFPNNDEIKEFFNIE